jgi:hypothetical protein
MPRYLLHHHHEPDECGATFASFRGFDSPLRHRAALTSCLFGGHSIWWTVDAPSAEGARKLLPFFVAERVTVTPITEVSIP